MAIINTTALDGSSNIFAMTTAINDASGQILAPFLLGTIFAILLIVLSKREGMKTSMLVASSITSLISVGFWSLDLLNFQFMLIPIIFMFGSVLVKVFTQD